MNNMVTIESEVYVQSVDNVTDGSVHAVKIQVLKGGIVVWNKDIIYTINTTLLVRKHSSNTVESLEFVVAQFSWYL